MAGAGFPLSCAARANSITLPSEGPMPLTRPFAATPKPGVNPFADSDVLVSGIVHPDKNTLSEKLKAGLAALVAGQAEEAIALGERMPANSLDRKTLTWAIAVSDIKEIPSLQFHKALSELKNWPGKSIIQYNFERALAREDSQAQQPPPQQIIAYFSDRKPVTADGMAILGAALIATGHRARARALIAPWWRTARLDDREEQLVIDKAGAALTKSDYQMRLISMIYANRLSSAGRIAQFANAASLYRGFAAVTRMDADAGRQLDAIDHVWKKQPIYTFIRIQYLRRTGKYEQAAHLMLRAPKDAASLTNPDAWWTERRVLSRELLDIGKPKIAYQIVAAHAAESPLAAADAEFHAGWYALRFLNNPKTAMPHFSRIVELSSRPISEARGFYWMGRAAEARHEAHQAHIFFQHAARYGTTLYGQLAAARLGRKKLDITYPRPTAEDRRQFETREPVKAIRLLESAGCIKEAALLSRELSYQLKTPGELAMLAVMAEHHDDYQTSVRIGKNAVQRGLSVGTLSHPLGAIPASANISAAGKALAYAIARQESEFNPTAVSKADARGMLQLLPATAKGVASRKGLPYSIQKLSSDPAYNATLGAHFLGEQLEKFDNSYILTFIAYNAGPLRANEWITRYGDPRGRPVDDVVDWIERIPYTETRNYVQRVMENYEVYKARLTGTADIKADLVFGRRTAGR